MSTPPEGWYHDPVDGRRQRWFDGAQWSAMVIYPGASRPTYEPMLKAYPPPVRSQQKEAPTAPAPQKVAALKEKWAHLATAGKTGVVAVVVLIVVGAAVGITKISNNTSPVADTTTTTTPAQALCADVETLIASRRTDTPQAPVQLSSMLILRDSTGADTAGKGATWLDGGRNSFDGPNLGTRAPEQWVQRTWTDGTKQMLQEFITPGSASAWDAASLRTLCAQAGPQAAITISDSSAYGAGAVSVTISYSSGEPDLIQISISHGQYRAVLWSQHPTADFDTATFNSDALNMSKLLYQKTT